MDNNEPLPTHALTANEVLARPTKPLAIADHIRDGWRLFAANPVPHIGYTAVMLIIFMVLNWVPVIGQLISVLIAAPLMGALYRALGRQHTGKTIGASDYLEVLNDPLPLVLLSLVMTLLITIGYFLLVLPGIYLTVAYLFAVPLVVFHRFDFWSAMETSRKFINRQWFAFFVLMLVIFVLNVIGMSLFGIGLLVTIPFASAIVVVAYQQQIGLPQPSLAIEPHAHG